MGPAGIFVPWRKALKYGLIAELVVLCFFTTFLFNVFSMVSGRGFIVPYQSSLFQFSEVGMNEGSGEYWLRGKDSRYYYSIDDEPGFLYIRKDNSCPDFNFLVVSTWCPEQTKRGFGGWELAL